MCESFSETSPAHDQCFQVLFDVRDTVLENADGLPTAHEQVRANSICTFSEAVDMHERVRSTSLPNFKDCRLPVRSRLHISSWRLYLQDYYDNV